MKKRLEQLEQMIKSDIGELNVKTMITEYERGVLHMANRSLELVQKVSQSEEYNEFDLKEAWDVIDEEHVDIDLISGMNAKEMFEMAFDVVPAARYAIETLKENEDDRTFGEFIEDSLDHLKPVVPEEIARAYDSIKDLTLYHKFKKFEYNDDARVRDWYDNKDGRNRNKQANAQEVIARMDLFGYRVEKKIYIVRQEKNGKYFMCFDEELNPGFGLRRRAFKFDSEAKAMACAQLIDGIYEEFDPNLNETRIEEGTLEGKEITVKNLKKEVEIWE